MKHMPPPIWGGNYVAFEPANQMVFVDLANGKIDLSIYLSNECGDDDGIIPAMEAWLDDTAPSIIAPHFTVASPVDYLIDGHEMPAVGNVIDIDAKPVFDALRAEFAKQIARIDALVFAKSS